ncbi:MAG: SulP family inorganic anion transporter [Cyclobacteriaceae bacterium]|nr:SulP family inorganic anion transporter [Cyclobacteriaceae bacterium]UYN88193.1 MAG: SulP family inorganic anion transporter [Cyclobacteriaceae bacterium]
MNLNGYDRRGLFSSLRYDFPASLVVFFVALPLCLGIALASGAPLFAGVIAGVVGGIVVASISNSQLGVSGPAAGLTVIVLTAIQQLGSFEVFLVAVVLAGLIQIGLGFARAGIIGYYFPTSVIKGMLTAIGIIIILKQIPHAFGYDADYEGDFAFEQTDGHNTFSELLYMADAVTPAAILISTISLSIILLWDLYLTKRHQFFKLVPGPLVAVVVGILYQSITQAFLPAWSLSNDHLVSVPVATNIKSFLGQFSLPDFSAVVNQEVWVVAFTLAVVASIESLLSVEATDKLDPYKRTTNTNRELIAQGSGNMISGLIGGLPVTQVILRSSANIQSGGKTKMSAIMHGFLLLLCVVAIPRILNLIPLSVLAAVLLVVGYKLAKPSVFKDVARLGWSQFLPFIATVLGVVFTDLLKGIGIGMVVAVIIILRNSYKNSHFIHKRKTDDGDEIRMTLAEEVVFLNKGSIRKELSRVKEGTKVTIDMSRSVHIDYDVMEIIEDFKSQAKSKNINVEVITNIHKPVAKNGGHGKEMVKEFELDSH